jgi:hypothetical protein
MELRDRLSRARRVAVLTGSGVSAESGVPTFRGADGLWRQYRAEDLATPASSIDPDLFGGTIGGDSSLAGVFRIRPICHCQLERPGPADHAECMARTGGNWKVELPGIWRSAAS